MYYVNITSLNKIKIRYSIFYAIINIEITVLFIDRHMVHEVTSPVAFLGLKKRKINVLFPNRTFATADHNTPTINQHLPVSDPLSAKQLKALETNAKENGISYCSV